MCVYVCVCVCVCVRMYVCAGDADGNTALMTAAFKGHDDAVEALLAAGADSKLADKQGRVAADWYTPLALTPALPLPPFNPLVSHCLHFLSPSLSLQKET